MDTNLIVNGAVIVGAVNFMTIAFPKMTSLHKILAAVVIGGVLPYLPNMIPFWQGVEAALMASGAYKLTQKVGGR